MVALNNDRVNTAFIIGDTPMRLAPNGVDLVNWSNNADNATGLSTNDPYLGVYYPGCAETNDVQGNTIIQPASHIILRTFIHSDNMSYMWFAPAGTRRGMVDNATSVGYIDSATGEYNPIGVSQGLRDTLYETRINPITNLPGLGLVVWGQKTRNPVASSMDRVNVARLVNYIRTILAHVGNGFLFEPNDKITRDQIKTIISGAVNDLVAKRGVYDYLVVCDEFNNTPTRIARNELYVDVAIEPMKDVEFIYIPIRLYNPGDIAKL
jgi:phage tail sheath protein FI